VTWISLLCLGICGGIVLSVFRHEADPFSPARVFGFIWSVAIGLAEFKFSALQHDWSIGSWLLLLAAISAFLAGTFVAYVLNLGKDLVPIRSMRRVLRHEEVHEARLFLLICVSVATYGSAYIANFLIKGWLPIFVIAKNVSRVDFNVSGLTLFLYSAAFIVFFTLVYHLQVRGHKGKKAILTVLAGITVGSYLLLLQRFQIIMATMICFTLLYYATNHIRFRTALPFVLGLTGFFFWMSSLRLSHLATAFLYRMSKMRFSIDYAFFTEPYMYLVMNLENFSRSVDMQDYHTYGYFTFDFVAAMAGLKYWILEYFGVNRTPFLVSGYNTYTAFYWFYSDFGVIGLAVISGVLGMTTGLLYYRMRIRPTVRRVTAYAVMVFVMCISFFVFPLMHLWFVYNMLALYLVLRWTMAPRRGEEVGSPTLVSP
jgi:oligosaccharide repeat unit polymerase